VVSASMVVPLSEDEARRRARALRVVLTDVDGVLTDTGVYYSERGEELKRFSVRDGMGVELLRNAGIETGFLTREISGAVKARAAKLRIERYFAGVKDKRSFLETILEDTDFEAHEIAFIGDDVNDAELLRALSATALTAAPADAMPIARDAALYQCRARGGEGAFRDFAEWILALRRCGREARRSGLYACSAW
jgi:3-deoxy-D-manno-octulosonate 8-phosphate phosphatase (KDO 8-P phosphatase)